MSGFVLGIDGALGPFSVALAAADGAVAPRALAGAGADALERGLDLVDRVLGGVRLRELERIVVTTGPGSFTGMRIAISYAKSLAFAASVPLAGIGTFEVLEPETAGSALVVIRSRTGRANGRLRSPDGTHRFASGSYAEVAAMVAEALPQLGTVTVAGAAAGVCELLRETGFHVISAPSLEPIALVVAARGRRVRALESPHALVAEYGEGYA